MSEHHFVETRVVRIWETDMNVAWCETLIDNWASDLIKDLLFVTGSLLRTVHGHT